MELARFYHRCRCDTGCISFATDWLLYGIAGTAEEQFWQPWADHDDAPDGSFVENAASDSPY
jgi:hypothetical protein